MNKHITALYMLAWGLAIGVGLTVLVYIPLQQRHTDKVVAEAVAKVEARAVAAEERADRVAEQIKVYAGVAEAKAEIAADRDKAKADLELALRAAEGWADTATRIALDWEAAFMRYEIDRRAARDGIASEEEALWMAENPAGELARQIRPASARGIIGSETVASIVKDKGNH